MRTARILAAALVVFAGAWGLAPQAAAQRAQAEYPQRSVRLIVPYPMGTANEVFARLVAQRLGATWGRSVYVDAIPGAGGVVGTQALAGAPADGHTLGWISSPHAINAAIYERLPYDSVRDFQPIVHLAATPMVFVTGAQQPYRTLSELIDAARNQPGGLDFGSNGNGSASHLATEMLASAAGVTFSHVPYKSTGQLTTDLIGGRVNFAVLGLAAALPLVEGGQLRALAVTSAEPAPALPQVPPAAETVAGYETTAWMGLIAPAGVPDAVLERVAADAAAALEDPELAKAMQAQGLAPDVRDAAGFGARIRDELQTWQRIVQEAGIQKQ